MPERLLTPKEVADRLGVSERLFRYRRSSLIANGLQVVGVTGRCGRQIARYREASLDRLIARAAHSEGAVC